MRTLFTVTVSKPIPMGSILNVVEHEGVIEVNVLKAEECLGVGELASTPKPRPLISIPSAKPPVIAQVPVVPPVATKLTDGKRISRSVMRNLEIAERHLRRANGAGMKADAIASMEFGASANRDNCREIWYALTRLRANRLVESDGHKWRWIAQ